MTSSTATDLDRIMDAFPGAEIEVTINPPVPSKSITKLRKAARNQVRLCRACDLRAGVKRPTPMTHITGRVDFVVVGEGPGKHEDRDGEPFVGKAGQLLRSFLMRAGFDLNRVGFCNVVSCWPYKTDGRGVKSSKTPSATQQNACRPNLMAQIEAYNTPYVLLTGATALSAFRPDLKIARDHGKLFVWNDTYVVMPIYHPAAALRDRHPRRTLRPDLELWEEVVKGGWDKSNVLNLLPHDCVICGRWWYRRDRDGVPYCDDHWEESQGLWTAARERLRKGALRARTEKGTQEDMF